MRTSWGLNKIEFLYQKNQGLPQRFALVFHQCVNFSVSFSRTSALAMAD